jgi:hypothetical protein
MSYNPIEQGGGSLWDVIKAVWKHLFGGRQHGTNSSGGTDE